MVAFDGNLHDVVFYHSSEKEATDVKPRIPSLLARRDKQSLTYVPEEEPGISYRFNVTLVGAGARDFATMVCSSEANAYKPKPLSDDEDSESAQSPSGGRSPGESSAGSAAESDELVLFCPIGGSGKEVARVRFKPLDKFSESIPFATRDAAVPAVALLFWNIDSRGDRTNLASRTPTEECLSDFRCRLAEIKHSPQRLYISLLAFDPDTDQSNQLSEFAQLEQQGLKAGESINLAVHDNDCDFTLLKAMQKLVDDMIAYRLRPSVVETVADVSGLIKSRSCLIL